MSLFGDKALCICCYFTDGNSGFYKVLKNFISSIDYFLFVNFYTLFSSRPEPTRFLLKFNPSLNAVDNVQKNTALHWAITSGNTSAVDLLLEAGASLDIKNVKVQFLSWYSFHVV